MTTVPASTTTTALPRRRAAVILIAATALAIAINALVAYIALTAGVSSTFGGLTAPAYTSMTIVGMVVGWVGWRVIATRARNPRKALTIAVPAVLVASFVPDILLATLQFMPGTTATAVAALAVMHVVVVAIAVPAYASASRSLTRQTIA